MAKINKSEEIRKLHASGIASGAEIVAKLKAKGIKVAPSQVYQVLAHKNKKGKKSRKKTAGHKPTVPPQADTLLDTAITFVRAVGGIEAAQQLLSKLATLKA